MGEIMSKCPGKLVANADDLGKLEYTFFCVAYLLASCTGVSVKKTS